ncbi:MAG: hydroxymyristoyl-ACP dehydratase [Wenzhouxiangella sp.]|nr:MAG: hydroxymyristoyl-ACP dehydratase [Wenzhouxiangella sp.]
MASHLNTDTVCIADLVPHAGSMVLLHEIVDYDSEQIHCRAHCDPTADHPLAHDQRLPAAALAEYGAQAMAVHGGLLAEPGSPPRPGRLVAMGQLELAVDSLDQATELSVRATRFGGDDAGQLYGFEVHAGERCLASGRATVMFAATGNDSGAET